AAPGRWPWLGVGEGGAEALVGAGEVVAEGPGPVEGEGEPTGVAGQSGGGVEELVAQGVGFGFGQVAVQGDQLQPGDEGGGDDGEGEPGFVGAVVPVGQVQQAGRLPGAD